LLNFETGARIHEKEATATSDREMESKTTIAGRYVRETKSENAEFDVSILPDDRVRITGRSLWGISNQFGPNIGTVDFVAAVLDGSRVTFKDQQPGLAEYTLDIVFSENGATVKDRYVPGYFGNNVSFTGEYKKR